MRYCAKWKRRSVPDNAITVGRPGCSSAWTSLIVFSCAAVERANVFTGLNRLKEPHVEAQFAARCEHCRSPVDVRQGRNIETGRIVRKPDRSLARATRRASEGAERLAQPDRLALAEGRQKQRRCGQGQRHRARRGS